MSALITSQNRPKVIRIRGRLISFSNRPSVPFTKPMTTAAMSAVPKPLTINPGTNRETSSKHSALKIQCASNLTMQTSLSGPAGRRWPWSTTIRQPRLRVKSGWIQPESAAKRAAEPGPRAARGGCRRSAGCGAALRHCRDSCLDVGPRDRLSASCGRVQRAEQPAVLPWTSLHRNWRNWDRLPPAARVPH